MKENLFFRATKSNLKKGNCNSFFLKFILLPLLCITSFFNASALENHIPAQDQAIIYVGENTVIYGSSQIFNAKIIPIEKEFVAKKKIKYSKKNVTIQNQISATKDKTDKKLKLLQQKINKQVKSNFFSSSLDSDLMKFAKVKFANVATTYHTSIKYHKEVISVENILSNYKVKSTQQKFFTSLSYSEFCKLTNSFLRGPPLFIYFYICNRIIFID